jgi:hypothetical protein
MMQMDCIHTAVYVPDFAQHEPGGGKDEMRLTLSRASALDLLHGFLQRDIHSQQIEQQSLVAGVS